MKICAIICEYNPFHNGHLYHLTEAKQRSGADAVLCIMSGNFVQRGEAAIIGKYARARHAVLAGADAVIELPSVFSTSCAEIFAKGAIKLLSAIPEVEYLAFGAENADTDFLSIAKLLTNEPKEVSEEIKRLTDEGESCVKARSLAWAKLFPNRLPLSPNDILATEYAKAILAYQAKIVPLAIKRKGDGYNDRSLESIYPSATAIREAISNGQKDEIESRVPSYVFTDLPKTVKNALLTAEKLSLINKSPEEIARVLDCIEGLENALKREAELNADNLVERLTSRRYTASRIRRILLQNLLNIQADFVQECLNAPLYLHLLAVNGKNNPILSALGNSPLPLIARTNDRSKLSGTALASFQKDELADSVYAVVLGRQTEKRNIF